MTWPISRPASTRAKKTTSSPSRWDSTIPILSDPTKKTAEAYGVVHEGRPVAERWTFYIGPDGVVKAVDQKVNTKEHAKDIAKQLEAIRRAEEVGVEKAGGKKKR